MNNLNFFTVDKDYVSYLQQAEQEKRGFYRVPNCKYGNDRKEKFFCGVVLEINNCSYFVPVTSYKIQMQDNFLIRDKRGNVVSSLRFNYMFPVPLSLTKIRSIKDEEDEKYKILLAQELSFCIKNQDKIRYLANRTYKRVLLGKDLGLVNNSCDFLLLEEQAKLYIY